MSFPLPCNEERMREGGEGMMGKGMRGSAIWEGRRWGLGGGSIDWAGDGAHARCPSSRMGSGDKPRHGQLPEITWCKRRQEHREPNPPQSCLEERFGHESLAAQPPLV